jgi:hypothetical protein
MIDIGRRAVLGGLAALPLATARSPLFAAYRNERIDGPGYVVNGVTKWLLPNFGDTLREQVKGTPFSLALVCAIAYQESGYRWWRSSFRANRTPAQVLRLLVLDDAAPRPRQQLTHDTGSFRASPTYGYLADGLVAAANAARSAANDSDENPYKDKLRYGYGLFQNDLQNIEIDPHFWTESVPGAPNGEIGLWGDINASTSRFMAELRRKYDVVRNVDAAVHNYNGSGPSADIYLHNVQVFKAALEKSGT